MLASSSAQADPERSLEVRTAGEFSTYIDTDYVTVFTPTVRASVADPLSGWSAQGSYLVDIVSAASVDIVSTASPNWVELRHAGSLSGTYQPDDIAGTIFGAVSVEPDYRSLSGGAKASIDLDRKNLTLLGGYGYTRDTAGRTGTPFSVYALELDRHELTLSGAFVLDRATLLTLTGDLGFESGRQEKPYRYLPLFSPPAARQLEPGASVARVNALRLPGKTAERVPETRQRYALTARFAHRGRASTLIANQRLYADSWGLIATTSDLRYVVDVSRRVFVWPELRWHTQRGVGFWRLAYLGEITDGSLSLPRWRTGDRELGPLWSATLGGGVRWNLGGADPSALSLVLELEAVHTDYLEALYIDQRWAGFASLQAEVRL
jgi:hypothetical protein